MQLLWSVNMYRIVCVSYHIIWYTLVVSAAVQALPCLAIPHQYHHQEATEGTRHKAWDNLKILQKMYLLKLEAPIKRYVATSTETMNFSAYLSMAVSPPSQLNQIFLRDYAIPLILTYARRLRKSSRTFWYLRRAPPRRGLRSQHAYNSIGPCPMTTYPSHEQHSQKFGIGSRCQYPHRVWAVDVRRPQGGGEEASAMQHQAGHTSESCVIEQANKQIGLILSTEPYGNIEAHCQCERNHHHHDTPAPPSPSVVQSITYCNCSVVGYCTMDQWNAMLRIFSGAGDIPSR